MKDDLFNECYDRKVSPEEFKQVFCNRCRNPRCQLAGWANDQFGSRMENQIDRLFNAKLASPDDPRFQHLHEAEFPNLLKQAIRLNIADQRGDWSLPEENVVLAPIAGEPASEESESLVDEALKNLKPQPENPEEAEEPNQDDAATYRASENEQNRPEFFEKSDKPLESQGEKDKKAYSEGPKHFQGNTEFPDEGVMIGGGEPPEPNEPPQVDPWAPKKKETFIKPGATVKMGGKKK